jgi:UDP-glucuronate 4-epimerase
MAKRIFVTGAAGFIGFHLCRYLSQRKDEVLGFDNFNDYYSPQLKRDRAKELSIKIIEGDITNFNVLKKLIHDFHPTHIVHLAAQAGVRMSLSKPTLYVDANITGFLNVLETLKEKANVHLIYASSSSVYGFNEKEPFAESDPVDKQASLYGVTKRCNELMATTYHHLYGIPVTGLRFFTVYGPWGRPDMAYFSFTKKILNNEPIEVFNEGRMKRDFTYIDDIIEGTVQAIDLGAKCEFFNLGNHQPVELNEFIKIIEKATGKKAMKIMKPMQKGDVLATYADLTKSNKYLHFKPKTSLDIGIHNFVQWFQEYQKR